MEGRGDWNVTESSFNKGLSIMFVLAAFCIDPVCGTWIKYAVGWSLKDEHFL